MAAALQLSDTGVGEEPLQLAALVDRGQHLKRG